MNEPDEEIDEQLAPLRAVEPPHAVQEANRRAALDARMVTPWWRRSVAVPVPVAAAVAASLIVSLGWGWNANRPDLDPASRVAFPPLRATVSGPRTPHGHFEEGFRVHHSYIGSLESAASPLARHITSPGGRS